MERQTKMVEGPEAWKAFEGASSYIEARSQPEARIVDKKCETTGGRIHIATIKPIEGFAWVPKMEPLSEIEKIAP